MPCQQDRANNCRLSSSFCINCKCPSDIQLALLMMEDNSNLVGNQSSKMSKRILRSRSLRDKLYSCFPWRRLLVCRDRQDKRLVAWCPTHRNSRTGIQNLADSVNKLLSDSSILHCTCLMSRKYHLDNRIQLDKLNIESYPQDRFDILKYKYLKDMELESECLQRSNDQLYKIEV